MINNYYINLTIINNTSSELILKVSRSTDYDYKCKLLPGENSNEIKTKYQDVSLIFHYDDHLDEEVTFTVYDENENFIFDMEETIQANGDTPFDYEININEIAFEPYYEIVIIKIE